MGGHASASRGVVATGKSQYEYWKHAQPIIDVIDGHGGTFSREGPEGKAFHTRSRVFTEAELAELNKA